MERPWLTSRFAAKLLIGVIVLFQGVAHAGTNTWTSNGPVASASALEGWIVAIAIDPSTSTLYAGGDGVVYKSTDSGASWSGDELPYFGPELIYGLVIDSSTTPSTLYAGIAGIYKTTDGGGSWNLLEGSFSDVVGLVTDPSTPSTLFAATGGGSVFKSTDTGISWNATSRSGRAGAVALVIDPKTPSTLYLAGGLSQGIYKTTDGGGSWSAINNGLMNCDGALYVNSLAIDPSTPSTLYAGTGNDCGVYKSTDGGGSWSPTGRITRIGTNDTLFAIAIDPNTPSTLYAGGWSGVHKSTNSGGSWTAITNGLPRDSFGDIVTIFSLAIDPSMPSRLYAGTRVGVSDIEFISEPPPTTNTPTRVPTNTASPTVTTPSPSPTALPPNTCAGDCDGSGDVTVNEIITLVNIDLGNALPCPNGIPSGGSVDITMIIQAVNNALNGCA